MGSRSRWLSLANDLIFFYHETQLLKNHIEIQVAVPAKEKEYMQMKDSFQTKSFLTAAGKSYTIFSLRQLEKTYPNSMSRLPISLRILLENLLRQEDGRVVRREDIEALVRWDAKATPDKEIAFMPARVLLQDFTGVPCVVDLAVMPRRDGENGRRSEQDQSSSAGRSRYRSLCSGR